MGDASLVDWTAEGRLYSKKRRPIERPARFARQRPDGVVSTLWRDHDPAWWSPTRGPATKVSPDGKSVAFFSDRTGWSTSLRNADVGESDQEAKQLTMRRVHGGIPGVVAGQHAPRLRPWLPGNQMDRLLSTVDVMSGQVTSRSSSRRGVQHRAGILARRAQAPLSAGFGGAFARSLRSAG